MNSLCAFLLLIAYNSTAGNIQKQYDMVSIKENGTLAPKEYFTGTVWMNRIVTPEDKYNTVVVKVSFEEKARTNWPTHTSGQILIVTTGVGYYQEKGKPVQVIREGDVVKIPKNVEHWHGASHDSSMTHTAIIPDSDKDKTTWLKPVIDEEYDQGNYLQ